MGFAGAQNQGERRRRRLANDKCERGESKLDASILAEYSSENVLDAGHVASVETLGMIGRVVSPQLWKQVVFLVVVGALISALIWHSISAATRQHPGPLADSKVFQSLAGLLLLFSGQLSFLIGWVRQESVIDFRGRYRWWRWMATATVCLAVLLITNTLQFLPVALAAVVEPLTGSIVAARPALVAVPGMAFCLVVLSRILPDMSRSPGSQSLFVVALLTVVVRQGLVSGSTTDSISTATLDAMLVSAAFFMFASSLLHCRFVAYICNDPPLARRVTVTETPMHVENASDEPARAKPRPKTAKKNAAPDGQSAAPQPAKKPRRKSRATKRKAA